MGREGLLPRSWITEATRLHVVPDREDPDWSQGYGFQFWRSRHGYRGDGAYGQYMVILPEADAVVAITSQSPAMQVVLDALWMHLLPVLTARRWPVRRVATRESEPRQRRRVPSPFRSLMARISRGSETRCRRCDRWNRSAES